MSKKVVLEEEIQMGPMEELVKAFYEVDLEMFEKYLKKEEQNK